MDESNPFEIKRKIARLNDLLDRAQRHMERAFGRSTKCIMGNDHEHARWARVKNNEPVLADQDDAGRALLPTWGDLTSDLYSALRRTSTVLYDEDQIAPTHRGNRKLLEPVVTGGEWERIHDMTIADDNMSVIAALKIQEGWITELKRQKDEAEQRRQEQQERAQQRQREKEEQADGDDSGGSGEAAGSEGPDQVPGAGAGEGQEGDAEGDDAADAPAGQAGGRARGNGHAAGGDEDGDVDGNGESEGAPGGAAGGGSGAGSQGAPGAAGQEDVGFDGEPEPNNSIEAAEAGAQHASAVQSAALALEAAQRLAEAIGEGQDIDVAIAAAEAALEAAAGLVEASDDTLERILAQEAYDEMLEGALAPDALKKAMKAAAGDLKDQESTLRAWGLGKGDLQEMDPTEVMELFKLLRSDPGLKKIADLLGYQRREIQKRKTRDRYAHGPEVRVGIEQGRKLNRMLSSQKLLMKAAPNVFAYRYVNSQLQQHKMKMREIQERGDGWLWIDGSGSMWAGSPYTYTQIARATAITVVDYFQEEGRNCMVGIFDDGVREIIKAPAGLSKVQLLKIKLQIAQNGYGGGTDFYAPLLTGLKGIQEGVEFWDKSSMVLITDGQCYMSEQQCQEIKRLQEETRVDIQTWLMPGGRAEQMKQFGPVDSLQTSLEAAGKTAVQIIGRMDAQYQP